MPMVPCIQSTSTMTMVAPLTIHRCQGWLPPSQIRLRTDAPPQPVRQLSVPSASLCAISSLPGLMEWISNLLPPITGNLPVPCSSTATPPDPQTRAELPQPPASTALTTSELVTQSWLARPDYQSEMGMAYTRKLVSLSVDDLSPKSNDGGGAVCISRADDLVVDSGFIICSVLMPRSSMPFLCSAFPRSFVIMSAL